MRLRIEGLDETGHECGQTSSGWRGQDVLVIVTTSPTKKMKATAFGIWFTRFIYLLACSTGKP